ncbi:unnamed protein product [Rotaria sp. Silwood2]|nr:unnamed protein product [Rotaria sp. Silwood2]
MMSHRNEERDDYRNSSRHNRQDIQHITNLRTQHIPSSRHNMDRYSIEATHLHSGGYDLKDSREQSGYFFGVLILLSYFLVIITFPLSLCFCLKVVQEYERAVIFRLGRILANGARGPGLFFILPCIDTYSKVDLRTVTFDVPPQEILTRDSVTVAVDAVVYFRIFNAVISITNVEDAAKSTKLLAATTLRNVLGTKTLHEILAERDKIDTLIQTSLDEATDPWGVKVERVEVKDVRLPVALQKAMAAEAEASRDARAKIIAAEGEMKASRGLKEAADIINESPVALQLRLLQTLTQIAAERNSTIVFPIPVEILQALSRKNMANISSRRIISGGKRHTRCCHSCHRIVYDEPYIFRVRSERSLLHSFPCDTCLKEAIRRQQPPTTNIQYQKRCSRLPLRPVDLEYSSRPRTAPSQRTSSSINWNNFMKKKSKYAIKTPYALCDLTKDEQESEIRPPFVNYGGHYHDKQSGQKRTFNSLAIHQIKHDEVDEQRFISLFRERRLRQEAENYFRQREQRKFRNYRPSQD